MSENQNPVKKSKIESTKTTQHRIKLNVGGKLIETTKETLMGSGYFRRVFGWDTEPSKSIFSTCCSAFFADDEPTEPFFIDETPSTVETVIDHLRHPDVYVSPEYRWMLELFEVEYTGESYSDTSKDILRSMNKRLKKINNFQEKINDFQENNNDTLNKIKIQLKNVETLDRIDNGQDDTNNILQSINEHLKKINEFQEKYIKKSDPIATCIDLEKPLSPKKQDDPYQIKLIE